MTLPQTAHAETLAAISGVVAQRGAPTSNYPEMNY